MYALAAIVAATAKVQAADVATQRQPYADTPSAAVSFSLRLTFTQGFLAGQLSVVIIALLAIRYVIFEDSRTAKMPNNASQQQHASKDLPLRRTTSLASSTAVGSNRYRNAANPSAMSRGDAAGSELDVAQIMSDILAKVQYEMDSHASESIDWINVIVAQALAGYRQDLHSGGWSAASSARNRASGTGGLSDTGDPGIERVGSNSDPRSARDWIEDVLNFTKVGRGMSFLDPIQVTRVELGDSYPVFSNAKVRPADDMGRMRVEVDVDYTDCISLAIETKLLINFPRPRFAVLPISLGLTVERFSGTLAIELFSNSPSSVLPHTTLSRTRTSDATDAVPLPRSRHELHFSLHPDFALFATATSLVGSRAKLQDLPKIEQLLVGRLRSYIHDRFVWPKYWSLTLPNLVPRNMPARTSGKPDTNGSTQEEWHTTDTRNDDPQRSTEIHLHGPGNALADEKRLNGSNVVAAPHPHRRQQLRQPHDDVFFETPPPLFPGVFQQQQQQQQKHQSQHSHHTDDHRHPVPGALPSVEAWRSQAALSTGARGRGAAGSGALMAESLPSRTPPSASSHAVTSPSSQLYSAAGGDGGDRRPELRHRATYNIRDIATTAPPSTGS